MLSGVEFFSGSLSGVKSFSVLAFTFSSADAFAFADEAVVTLSEPHGVPVLAVFGIVVTLSDSVGVPVLEVSGIVLSTCLEV